MFYYIITLDLKNISHFNESLPTSMKLTIQPDLNPSFRQSYLINNPSNVIKGINMNISTKIANEPEVNVTSHTAACTPRVLWQKLIILN